MRVSESYSERRLYYSSDVADSPSQSVQYEEMEISSIYRQTSGVPKLEYSMGFQLEGNFY